MRTPIKICEANTVKAKSVRTVQNANLRERFADVIGFIDEMRDTKPVLKWMQNGADRWERNDYVPHSRGVVPTLKGEK